MQTTLSSGAVSYNPMFRIDEAHPACDWPENYPIITHVLTVNIVFECNKKTLAWGKP